MAYTFVAGHYTATYASSPIGASKEGFTIRIEYLQRDIVVDEQGEGVCDQLQSGMNMFVDLDYCEYTLIAPALMAQQGGVVSQGTIIPQVGKLLSSLAGILVLTPSTTRTNNTDIYTFAKAIVVDEIPILLSSNLRSGPITFRILPDNAVAGKHYVKSGS